MFHNDIMYHLHDSCFEKCVCLFIMYLLFILLEGKILGDRNLQSKI